MSGLIYIPDPWEDFSFYLEDPKIASDAEFDAMVQLNLATDDWLKGKVDTAEYTDYLSYHNVNVDDHLKPIDWYVTQLEK